MMGDTSNYLALAVKPIDVATPLMQAAKIQQSQMEAQQTQIQMHRDAIGAEARGLAPLVGTPDYEPARQASTQRLAQMGILSNPQAQAGWERDSSSPLGIQSLIARTQSPELAFKQKEADRAQTNRDNPAVPEGFAKTPTGLQAVPGGPQDPSTIRARTMAGEKPMIVSGGASVYDPVKNEVVFQNASGKFDDATLGAMADQYLAGDKSVMQNLGRGAQGAENIVALRKAITERGIAQGMNPAQIATKLAEFEGQKAGARALGTMEAKMGTAAFEAEGAIKLARDIIEKVPRTSFLPFNQLIQGYQNKTLNPDQAELYTRTQGVINTYAAVMSRGANITTDASRHRAEELLNTAANPAVYNRVLDTMVSEINMAKESPERMRQFYGQKYGAKSASEGGTSTPTKTATPGNDRPEISEARVAIAKGAPRDAVEKRLKEKGIKYNPTDLDMQ